MQLEVFQRQENKVVEIKTTENYTSHKLMCIRLYFQINEQQKKKDINYMEFKSTLQVFLE